MVGRENCHMKLSVYVTLVSIAKRGYREALAIFRWMKLTFNKHALVKVLARMNRQGVIVETSYDYIVIGGGSAGCVAAAKLSAVGTVLLLEAGHSHHHPLLDMPPGIFKMINGSKYMRYHTTTPQAHLDGRQHDIPQGHVLGGGSSVNAQVYIRGRPSDYDEWQSILAEDEENPGWGWDDVLPYFKGMESNNRLNNALHGVDGPMKVSDPGHIDDFSRWFVQAMQAVACRSIMILMVNPNLALAFISL